MPDEYPKRLIPTESHSKIDTPDPTHLLCRWVAPGTTLKDSQGRLVAAAVESQRIPFLSTNKIPESELEDIEILLLKEEHDVEWTVGEPGANVKSDDFKRISDRTFFLIRVGEIHNHKEKYAYPGGAAEKTLEFQVKVVHQPMLANYWHFILVILDANGQEVTYKGGWRKAIISDIRDHIVRHARFSLEDFGLYPSRTSTNQIFSNKQNAPTFSRGAIKSLILVGVVFLAAGGLIKLLAKRKS